MTINVVFRGPCLFVKGQANGKETLDYVLLPEGTRKRPNGGFDGEHPDHSRAKKHHAGLIVRNADGSTQQVIWIRDKRVTVRELTATEPCALDASFSRDRVVPVSELTNGPVAAEHLTLIDEETNPEDFWARVAAKITFKGGEIGAQKNSRLVFHFPTHHNPKPPNPRKIPLLAVWTPKSGNGVEIDIAPGDGGGAARTITLRDGQRAWIFNYDNPAADPDQMECEGDPCARYSDGESLEDYDFKWLYQVLEPPGGDWPKWLKDDVLPAPQSSCPGRSAPSAAARNEDDQLRVLSPDVASCFFGSWP